MPNKQIVVHTRKGTSINDIITIPRFSLPICR